MLRNTPNAESVIVEYGFLDNAKDNNTTVDKIKKINNLINNSLTIGQQLLLN